jgi:hypothetical protein
MQGPALTGLLFLGFCIIPLVFIVQVLVFQLFAVGGREEVVFGRAILGFGDRGAAWVPCTPKLAS